MLNNDDHDRIPARHIYEGSFGGWKDGRLGQAYDLIASVLMERDSHWRGHKLLVGLENEDENYV